MSIFREHKTIADRSATDRRRHKQKIEKAIREGLKDLISDESIITDSNKNNKTKYRIPVKGIKEYKFVYGDNQSKQVGSAPGKDIKKGQKIGDSQQQGQANGNKGGNDEGEEYYDVEITLEELAQYLFADLELPELQKKQLANVQSEKLKRNGYRPDGILPRLDKKKSAIARIKRMKASGFNPEDSEDGESFPFHEEDLKYRHYKIKNEPCTNAVIFFIMDVSGSMTDDKKFLARSLYFLMYQFLKTKYNTIDIVFISHDVKAREVDEKQFFSQTTNGGTIASSAIELTNEIIKERYHPSSWNIYAFQSSDGDNYVEDNNKYYDEVVDLSEKCQLFGYCEIDPNDTASNFSSYHLTNYQSGLTSALQPLQSEKVKITRVTDKSHIWKAFKHMLGGTGE